MNKNGLIVAILLILFTIVFYMGCDSDNPVELPKEYKTVSGAVFQEAGSYVSYISGATVRFGNITTLTNNSGNYEIAVPVGSYDVTVTHPDYDTAFAHKEVERNTYLNVSMTSPLYTVSGVVSNSIDGLLENTIIRLHTEQTITDSTGYYMFANVPRGKYSFSCQKDEYCGYLDSLKVPEETEKFVELSYFYGTISGIVTHQEDGPVENAQVSLNDSIITSTDINGFYQIDSLRQQSYPVKCSHPFYNDQQRTVIVKDTVVRQDFTLTKNNILIIGITEDAYVAYDNHNESVLNNNYGSSSMLVFEVSDWIDHVLIEQYTSYTMCFMKLPLLPDMAYDSVLLVLNVLMVNGITNFSGFSINPCTAEWQESTITYYTKPDITNPTLTISTNQIIDNRLYVNITEMIPVISGNTGFLLSAYCPCGPCYCNMIMCSSEDPYESARPVVIIYTTN